MAAIWAFSKQGTSSMRDLVHDLSEISTQSQHWMRPGTRTGMEAVVWWCGGAVQTILTEEESSQSEFSVAGRRQITADDGSGQTVLWFLLFFFNKNRQNCLNLNVFVKRDGRKLSQQSLLFRATWAANRFKGVITISHQNEGFERNHERKL